MRKKDNISGMPEKILIGNAFSMSLVRSHKVVIDDMDVKDIVSLAKSRGVRSFWGHENTRAVAEEILGVDLSPNTPRPAIVLDGSGFPTIDGQRFTECYVLSPNYRAGFRPAIGVEVTALDIVGWHALRLAWST